MKVATELNVGEQVVLLTSNQTGKIEAAAAASVMYLMNCCGQLAHLCTPSGCLTTIPETAVCPGCGGDIGRSKATPYTDVAMLVVPAL